VSDSSSRSTRWVPLAAAALIVLANAQKGGGSTLATAASVVLFLLAGATSLLGTRGDVLSARYGPRPAVLGVVSAALALPASLYLVDRLVSQSAVWKVAFSVVVTTLVGLAVAAPSASAAATRRWRAFAVAVIILVSGLSAASLGAVGRRIDVYMFLTEGVGSLLHGANPYTTTFPNVYSPQESIAYYGAGAVVGDHLAYGFPYLPGALLDAVPGYLLGDVRFSGVLLLGLLSMLVLLTTADLRGRFVALTLVTAPVVMAVITGSWTEPAQVALVGFAVVALKRRHLLVAAILLGLAFATKQYLVVALPALWLLRGVFGRRQWLALVGTALVVTLPFVVAAPHEFWRAVVEWQLIQPFRPDSVSLLALSVNHLGWPPPAVYGLLPIAVGLAVALLLAWRLVAGPAAFLLAMALSLLSTVLLAKQAYINYYMFVGGCLLLAAWTASDDDPVLRSRSRSLPGEVAEVGDVRGETGIHA
jgi:hypothetical protein